MRVCVNSVLKQAAQQLRTAVPMLITRLQPSRNYIQFLLDGLQNYEAVKAVDVTSTVFWTVTQYSLV
jgi:hypothetical protein